MTSARIVFLERQYMDLYSYLFDREGIEGAAFVLCGQVDLPDCQKLIAQAVVPIAEDDFSRREALGLTLTSRALSRIAKLAKHENLSIIFAHSHPDGPAHFSIQDDGEESKLLPFLQARVPNRIHGTMVLTRSGAVGRLYKPEQLRDVGIITVGERIRFSVSGEAKEVPRSFDRQVRAFGRGVQSVLQSLNVGVVGLGGTGSPVAEQLCRLGVGKLTLVDGDRFDSTNVNRVYGSASDDTDELKTTIAKRHLEAIGLGMAIKVVPDFITFEDAARELSACDIVMSCTDKQIPRAILNLLSQRYSIPVFDLGVLIDSKDEEIVGVHGRVTTLISGEACLFCRGRISPEAMRIEALSSEEREKQIREGYAPELEDSAPSVIAFTTAVASLAVSELLHRFTGYMGTDRVSSELLVAFDLSRMRTNRVEAREICACTDESQWGRGDEKPFLGMVWPSRTK